MSKSQTLEILPELLSWSRAAKPSAMVTVVGTRGSSPRHSGTMMLVAGDGTLCSTIGGGRVELEIVHAARLVAQGERAAHMITHHLVRDLGMCCGGSMDFWIEPLQGRESLIENLASSIERRQEYRWRTNLKTGVKSEAAFGQALAPDPDSFVQTFRPAPRLVIFGAGHVARSLGPLASRMGYSVLLCDDNETGELDNAIPWATETLATFKISDLESRCQKLGPHDFVVVMTRDHALDEKILEDTLPMVGRVAYLGVIGSLGKFGRFKKRFAQKGMSAEWSQVRCPIGIDICAETPMEIAVSVMAELTRIKNADESNA